ncbi:MAG TPA: alpha/beta hydrolase [Thermoleophilaceae bacterium]|nr:alpha/beta hydrolase [Thermoleophilaceae bacterium]
MPELPGVQHHFFDLRGLRMHVAEAGAGDPVLLLHGWPQNWWMWRGVIPRLAESHRVICPDLRGFGWSDAPPGRYEKETLAADVLELLDLMGIERVDLIGHDWGGYIGFLLCQLHPERVRRFLALGTGPPWSDNDPKALLDAWRAGYQVLLSTPLLGRELQTRGHASFRALVRPGARGSWSALDEEIFLGGLRERARADVSVAIYRTFLTREVPAILRGRYDKLPLAAPTLLLNGEHDPVLRPRMTRGVAARSAQLTGETLPGLGHFIPDEAPELVVQRALEHFA